MPFILRWSGKTPANFVDDTTILCGADFLPTICSIAGITKPDKTELNGQDMSSAFFGTPQQRNTPLMWEFRFGTNGGGVLDRSPILAMRQDKWKLLMNPDGSRVELYDLIKDPGEVDNIAENNKNLVAEMSQSLLKWHKLIPGKDKIPPYAGSNAYPWPKSGDME